MDFDKRIEELFVELPEAAREIGGRLNAVQTGNLVFISGKMPYAEGRLPYKGRLGLELSLDHGKAAARAAVVQSLGALKAFLGGTLNRVRKIVMLKGYIASSADFKEHSKVLEDASKFLTDIFGNAGKHAVTAVGVSSLPNGAAVEVELIVEVK